MSTASDSHSPARGNGLSAVLSKARRGRNRKAADTNSVVSSNGSDGHGGLRSKLEGAMEKLTKHDDSEEDDEDNGGNGGIAKLIPKGISSRRRRKREERDAEQRVTEEAARGRTVAERGTLENGESDKPSTAEGDTSSLITYESENEEYVFPSHYIRIVIQ